MKRLKFLMIFMTTAVLWGTAGLSLRASSAEEYAFLADSRMEAEEMAEQAGGELTFYEYGVGSVRIPDGEAEVMAADLSNESDMAEREGFFPEVDYTTAESAAGSSSDPRQWYIDAVSVRTAWKYTKGKNAVVAVIDTGINADHPDLKKAVKSTLTVIPESEYDAVSGRFEPSYLGPEDYQGHGTAVAGIIAAADDNKGCVGIAPECRIVSIKALERKGEVGKGKTSWVAAAVRAAIEQKVNVINMSLGGSEVRDPVLQQAIEEALAQNITVVCAAGNVSGGISKVYYPAAYEHVIGVAALKQDGEELVVDDSYSNFGDLIDISAPGTSILTTGITGYTFKTGTSMACPVVSGAAALLYSVRESITPAEIEELLCSTAKDLETPGWDSRSGSGALEIGDMMLACAEKYDIQERQETQQSGGEGGSGSTSGGGSSAGSDSISGSSQAVLPPARTSAAPPATIVEDEEEDFLYTMEEPEPSAEEELKSGQTPADIIDTPENETEEYVEETEINEREKDTWGSLFFWIILLLFFILLEGAFIFWLVLLKRRKKQEKENMES